MEFSPTDQQEEFRLLARMWFDDLETLRPLVSDWVIASRESMEPPVYMSDWKLWTQEDGFTQWWEELFPEAHGATLTDVKITESLFWKTLIGELRAGDKPKALAAFARIQATTSAVNRNAVQENELEGWFNACNDGSAWMTGGETPETK